MLGGTSCCNSTEDGLGGQTDGGHAAALPCKFNAAECSALQKNPGAPKVLIGMWVLAKSEFEDPGQSKILRKVSC